MLLAAVDFHKPQFTWWQKTGPWICPHSCGLFFGRWLLWSWKKRIEVRKEKTAITDWLAVDKIQLKVFQTLRWQLRNSIQIFLMFQIWEPDQSLHDFRLSICVIFWFSVWEDQETQHVWRKLVNNSEAISRGMEMQANKIEILAVELQKSKLLENLASRTDQC